MRRPQEFPWFGRPVLDPFDGVVVAARGASRDQLTRLSPLGLIAMLLEGFVRSLGAPRQLLGNHVLLRADADDSTPDGTVVAVLTHLRRGSLQVAPGERVVAGQQIAECGISGNSSDPHVHFRLMDGAGITTAHALPFEWEHLGEDGAPRHGVPAHEELFVVEV